MTVDEKELRKAISLIKKDGQLFEVRMIPPSKNYKTPTYNAYFDDIEKMIESIKEFPNDSYTVYLSLNNVKDGCKSRRQYNEFLAGESTISDNDIDGYDYLFVDIDPARPKDISSSEEELSKTKEIANDVYLFMSNLGFSKPIKAYSGNGVHLLYKVFLGNTKENIDLMKECLISLDTLFSNEFCHIDVVNFNPSRVCKLYGTVARKGRNTKERPHRLAKVIGEYDDGVHETDIGYLKKLAKIGKPNIDEASKFNNYNPSTFNITDWMDSHGINYRASTYSDGDKYILDHCPFDSGHSGKDACLFRSRSGAIGFHCFHNSCADKTWKDVRILYEPNAYEKKQAEERNTKYNSFNRNEKKESKKIVKKDDVPIFLNAIDIFNIPKEEESFVRTGIDEIDRKMRGLKKGFVSVWSGLRGSAKSTVLSQIGINAVDYGNNVGFFSGELSSKNFMRWMMQQCAGKSDVEQGAFEGYYNVPRDKQKKISEWLGEHMWLYNNEYGNDSVAILDLFQNFIKEKKLDLLILDNLMAFDLSTFDSDKYEAQKLFCWKLHDIAQRTNTHIAFVAHPRKSMGFLRLMDISGSSDIGNIVENAFIVHRNNHDFKRQSKEMFGWKEDDYVYTGTNIIEICKDRDGGTQDFFIPLWYEVESKRLKNSQCENKIYGWKTKAEVDKGFAQVNAYLEEIPFD